ncbi:MAG: hypothetical protein ACFFCV_15905 [Promethearchaeota archaeon]
MVDNHSYSFFGQKVGLIIQSSSKNEPHIFFRLIKSKNDGSWEKPSVGEGKVIKFSLEEIVWIIRVLDKETNSWSSYHTFKDSKTQISFKWENGEYNKLWIHIGKYSKVLEYAQIKILELLMKHLLKEKIEFATTPNISKKSNSEFISNTIVQEEIITTRENVYNNKKYSENKNNSSKVQSVNGIIKGETNKALLIQFDNGTEIWIPKSRIHSSFDKNKNENQEFMIDDWILEKNKVVS